MILYRETLRPSWGLFLIAALVLPILTLTFAPFSVLFGVVASVVVFVVICIALVASAPTIEITESTLRVGKAKIERTFISSVSAFSGDPARAQRGVELDARAWTLFRGYIDPVVKVDLNDKNDPTPYWLFSTRRPKELAAVLRKTGGAPS